MYALFILAVMQGLSHLALGVLESRNCLDGTFCVFVEDKLQTTNKIPQQLSLL